MREKIGMLKLKNESASHLAYADKEDFKTKTLMKLKRLEEEILTLKGKRRKAVIETYRKLLWALKDEPIYLIRYE